MRTTRALTAAVVALTALTALTACGRTATAEPTDDANTSCSGDLLLYLMDNGAIDAPTADLTTAISDLCDTADNDVAVAITLLPDSMKP